MTVLIEKATATPTLEGIERAVEFASGVPADDFKTKGKERKISAARSVYCMMRRVLLQESFSQIAAGVEGFSSHTSVMFAINRVKVALATKGAANHTLAIIREWTLKACDSVDVDMAYVLRALEVSSYQDGPAYQAGDKSFNRKIGHHIVCHHMRSFFEDYLKSGMRLNIALDKVGLPEADFETYLTLVPQYRQYLHEKFPDVFGEADSVVQFKGVLSELEDAAMMLTPSMASKYTRHIAAMKAVSLGYEMDKTISAAHLMGIVCAHTSISESEIRSKRRARRICHARQVFATLAREFTPMTLNEIGECFGGKDHSTVSHAIDRGGKDRDCIIAIGECRREIVDAGFEPWKKEE
jgi:hypothetical protein